jgi:hypothetical protein
MERPPHWTDPVLQGTAYWLGMQQILGEQDTLTEGAITLTLRDLLRRHLKTEESISSEVMYKSIPEYRNDPEIRNSRTRADIVVFEVNRNRETQDYVKGQIKEIIEVKHHRAIPALVMEDIDFLGNRKEHHRSIRTFLIYTSMNRRPTLFTDQLGLAIRGSRKTDKGTNYWVRRVCRAVQNAPHKNATQRGHYSVMIEIGP